ncbi:signal peptidase I [Agromyces sp. Soil535]|uniref:signal peptidase I n=1 Tax=Agromyces sp. Soil535 TaxID=1736390 RepID=UPI0006F62C95|nr:signal peptidase I [Agromyces sp. Soil535]KRE25890.1 hypothetical protein ASG80_03380 [Agromyces sp. Soil535]
MGDEQRAVTAVGASTRRRGLSPWWHLLTALVVLALVQALLVKVYQVPSGSMEETLAVGDRILVTRVAYAGGGPARGDIVVFSASGAWDEGRPAEPISVATALKWIGGLFGIGPGVDRVLVKRVIGLPGEQVECCDAEGRVLVDGGPLTEPYVFEDLPFEAGSLDCASTPVSMRCFGPVDVPSGAYLVLGDHRSASADSVVGCRGAGPPSADCLRVVARGDVIGRADFVAWPPGRMGPVE